MRTSKEKQLEIINKMLIRDLKNLIKKAASTTANLVAFNGAYELDKAIDRAKTTILKAGAKI